MIGSSNQPLSLKEYSSFRIDENLQAMAFGTVSGNIMLYRAEK